MMRFLRPVMHFQAFYRKIITPLPVPPNLSSVAMRVPEMANLTKKKPLSYTLRKGEKV